MIAEELQCWKCGAALDGVPMPLSRLSVCLKCEAELYACLMCRFHDPKLRDGCREERAEHVLEKGRANFCEFFEPRAQAHVPREAGQAAAARTELDALFGGPTPESQPDPARAALDELFGGKPKG